MNIVVPLLLPVISDFIFKLIFGDQRNVDILAEFLKSVLNIPDSEYSHLIIVDPHVKKESKDDKYGILDVRCIPRAESLSMWRFKSCLYRR